MPMCWRRFLLQEPGHASYIYSWRLDGIGRHQSYLMLGRSHDKSERAQWPLMKLPGTHGVQVVTRPRVTMQARLLWDWLAFVVIVTFRFFIHLALNFFLDEPAHKLLLRLDLRSHVLRLLAHFFGGFCPFCILIVKRI